MHLDVFIVYFIVLVVYFIVSVVNMGHLTNYGQNVKFWTFESVGKFESRLPVEGRLCPKQN
jgi:hypothetical protein